MVGLVGEQDRCTALLGAGDERELAFDLALTDHYRSHLLDDSGLFTGYFFERVAEELRMIPADIRDDADQRADNVRRVEPSAHTHFDHRNVYPFPGEVVECDSGRNFEKRRPDPVDRFAVAADECHHRFFGDHLSVDANALAEIFQVRRRE